MTVGGKPPTVSFQKMSNRIINLTLLLCIFVVAILCVLQQCKTWKLCQERTRLLNIVGDLTVKEQDSFCISKMDINYPMCFGWRLFQPRNVNFSVVVSFAGKTKSERLIEFEGGSELTAVISFRSFDTEIEGYCVVGGLGKTFFREDHAVLANVLNRNWEVFEIVEYDNGDIPVDLSSGLTLLKIKVPSTLFGELESWEDKELAEQMKMSVLEVRILAAQ